MRWKLEIGNWKSEVIPGEAGIEAMESSCHALEFVAEGIKLSSFYLAILCIIKK